MTLRERKVLKALREWDRTQDHAALKGAVVVWLEEVERVRLEKVQRANAARARIKHKGRADRWREQRLLERAIRAAARRL